MGFLWVGDAVLGNEVADGHKGVKAFCNGPWETFLLGLILDVSRRHINSEDVA